VQLAETYDDLQLRYWELGIDNTNDLAIAVGEADAARVSMAEVELKLRGERLRETIQQQLEEARYEILRKSEPVLKQHRTVVKQGIEMLQKQRDASKKALDESCEDSAI
jgi:hypothetical protein